MQHCMAHYVRIETVLHYIPEQVCKASVCPNPSMQAPQVSILACIRLSFVILHM